MADQSDIPDFPLFVPDGPELAFGADTSRYYCGAGWDAAKAPSRRLSRLLESEAKAFRSMFYGGKSLNDAGYQPRPDLDEQDVMRGLVSLMRSWGVSSEQKEATVALAIHHWCEPIPVAESAADQAA